MHGTIQATNTKSIENRMLEEGKDYARRACNGYCERLLGEGKDLGNEFECKFE